MILREAVLSSEPRVLGVRHPHVRRAADEISRSSPAESNVSRFYENAQANRFGDEEGLASPKPLPAVCLEDVLLWLSACDLAQRATVAEVLAQDLEALKDEARAQGFTAGWQEGQSQASLDNQQALAALQALTQSAQAVFEKESGQLADQCAEIVAEAFVKLAGTHLVTREAALSAVLEVLRRVKEEREVSIRVNEADLGVLKDCESDIAKALNGRKLSLLADGRVELGGCIVESQLGNLDGRLEIQLRALFETLRSHKGAQGEAA